MAHTVKDGNTCRPVPGDAGYLEWRRQQAERRAKHAALLQAIAERGMTAREIQYRRLRQMMAEAIIAVKGR
jgi:hypothetical protein